MKKYSLYIVAIPLAITVFVFAVYWANKASDKGFIKEGDNAQVEVKKMGIDENSDKEDKEENRTQVETRMSTDENSNSICENEKEMTTFAKPVSIVWTATLGGCLVGCEGASFSRYPKTGEYKYPIFAAYGDMLKDIASIDDPVIVRITGKWTGIDADHPKLVFNNQCVPIVDIEKIEVVGTVSK